jgi:hypothetical protein
MSDTESSELEKQTITDKERLDYAWKHFALAADQRTKNFNFYLIVLIASLTLTVPLLNDASMRTRDFLSIGALHIVVSLSSGQSIIEVAASWKSRRGL